MKKGLMVVLFILIFCSILGSCGDSSSDSNYSRYSDTYRNDSEYRENVGDIADVFGVSEEEVDSKINAVTGGN